MKPPRTFGLSIAIVATVFLFTIVPLLQLAFVMLINARTSSIDFSSVTGESEPVSPLFSGGNFGGISNELLLFQTLLGIIFLIIAIFAWRGRPASIRGLMSIAVIVMTVFYVRDSFTALFLPTPITQGIDSGQEIGRALQCARFMGNLLVTLYFLWYINRGPARAFYRGYYLDDKMPEAQQDRDPVVS